MSQQNALKLGLSIWVESGKVIRSYNWNIMPWSSDTCGQWEEECVYYQNSLLIFPQISCEGQTVNIDCRQRRDFIPVFQFKSHFPLAPRLTDPQWSCKGQKFIVKHILLTGPVAVPGQEYSYNKMTLLSKRNCAITQPWWEGQKFTILISIHLQVLMTSSDKGPCCQDTFSNCEGASRVWPDFWRTSSFD